MHIVGEIQNVGTTNARFIRINFNLYDSSGNLIDTDFTFTTADIIAPGEKSPFHNIFSPQPGYDHYTIASVDPSSTADPPNHNFTTTITNTFTDSAGFEHIVGQVTNNNDRTAEFVEVIFTFYGPSGQVADADFTFINTDSSATLGPRETASFEEIRSSGAPAYSTLATLTESSSPPTLSKCPGYESTPGNHIAGTPGADVLTGTSGSDVICGLSGDDQIRGAEGSDLIIGGEGDDYVVGGPGNDTVLGGSGDEIVYGQEGDDTVDGGDGADRVSGGPGSDVILLRAGFDRAWGGGGDDRIYGQEGIDVLYGNLDDDLLDGGVDWDTLVGDSGNDRIVGGSGFDRLYGLAGGDRLYARDGGLDRVDGGTGVDVCSIDSVDTVVSC